MSGAFSIASHAALQNLPVVASQEQIGCAHFFAGIGVMSSSYFDRGAFDSGCIIDIPRKHCCPLRHTIKLQLNAYRSSYHRWRATKKQQAADNGCTLFRRF
jgi:hypothetical protein